MESRNFKVNLAAAILLQFKTVAIPYIPYSTLISKKQYN
jgi:hypothetical protein